MTIDDSMKLPNSAIGLRKRLRGRMARRARAAVVFGFSLILAAWFMPPGASAPEIALWDESTTHALTLLHTNDVHAQLLPDRQGRGGWAAIAAIAKQVRASQPRVLLLDAGDMTQGSPVSTIFKGKPIFDIMNAVGYDAAALGNHEFDNGVALIDDFARIARFPLLTANLTLRNRALADGPSTIVETGGVRVGLLALTTEDHSESRVESHDPIAAARQALPALRAGSDLIVVLSHLGYPRDQQLARECPELDVIIGGHSHTALAQPERVGSVLVAQAGQRGRYLGRLDLVLDAATRRPVSADGTLIEVPRSGLEPDAETARAIDHWERQVTGHVDQQLGVNPAMLTVPELRRRIERIWQLEYGTDFAFQNAGGTRAALAPGPIAARDIWNSMPFENTLCILTLECAQVESILGNPVVKRERDHYTLITNSYAARKIIKGLDLADTRVRWIDRSWRDPVLDYARRHGNLEIDTEAPAPSPAATDAAAPAPGS